jgi:hypothetical protein
VRVIVCGGRDYQNADAIGKALANAAPGKHTLVHGAAPGADSIAAEIARVRGWEIEAHPADWTTRGRAAGPLRNQEMIDSGGDLVLAFPGGNGTADCVRRARRAGIRVSTHA